MATKKRILVVEDELDVGSQIAQRLTKVGYLAEVVGDGLQAINEITQNPPDLIILDIMLPGTDGLEVARNVRKNQPRVSIVMLTARDDEIDQISGFDAGADYYLTKPFSPRVLAATVDAAFRRIERLKKLEIETQTEPEITIGHLRIDYLAHQVFWKGDAVHITPTELQLLDLLIKHPNEVMSRQKLLQIVWDWIGDASDTRTVDAHVRSLRSKLGDGIIRTIHGVGYSFDPQFVQN
ncbi:MAG: response regulator transcription factor [Bifidobacteriaceae bacterium]|jgi:DNA-binding response OmpR family regulator|nr:response regulator transcription factor [Bifidobacteriaceae bacterium]